jgi:hypothetical protein
MRNDSIIVKPEYVEGPIPSAFCRWETEKMDYLLIHLYKNIDWLTHVKVSYHIDFESIVSELILKHARNYFIVGCNHGNFIFLNVRGYQGIRVGKEAILDLHYNHFKKKSLKELVRRGKKHGIVMEVPFSKEAADKLIDFRIYTRHGHEPQLKYMFNTVFEECNRLFVIKNFEGLWLGAILLSFKSERFVQSETILCRRNAPVGSMEALIYEIFIKLQNTGYDYWSLGAVPFTISDSKFLSKEYVINVMGRLLKFAYNYKGLFNFKNKFNPLWCDYYICIRPIFSAGAILGIIKKSNLLDLVLYKLFHLKK